MFPHFLEKTGDDSWCFKSTWQNKLLIAVSSVLFRTSPCYDRVSVNAETVFPCDALYRINGFVENSFRFSKRSIWPTWLIIKLQ